MGHWYYEMTTDEPNGAWPWITDFSVAKGDRLLIWHDQNRLPERITAEQSGTDVAVWIGVDYQYFVTGERFSDGLWEKPLCVLQDTRVECLTGEWYGFWP
ncbi:hypothetical protein ACE7GA_26240 [Roseomonas sp. CCTCC AB2023176]|uniref:hypothetical protein n=1 Tax=Roseomonas sp. CCTCC AB2023176 TaxID=3342640 RepID=UPI0035E393E9